MALEQDHIPDAEPSQVEGRARPVGASSDDNDVSGGHSGAPMVAEPGTGRNPAGSHIFPEIFPETITVPETGARFRASTQHVYGIHPTDAWPRDAGLPLALRAKLLRRIVTIRATSVYSAAYPSPRRPHRRRSLARRASGSPASRGQA